MIRGEELDGRPLTAITIRCDQDHADFLLELLREHIGGLDNSPDLVLGVKSR